MKIVPKHSVSQYNSEPSNIYLYIYLTIQLEINPYIGAITVNGNIYFYWNYGGLLKITLSSLSFKSSLNFYSQTESNENKFYLLFCNLYQFIKLLILRVICYSRGCVILFIYICFLATNSYFLIIIFATQCLGPKIYQTMTFVISYDFSLKYPKCTPVGHKIKTQVCGKDPILY